MKVLIVEDFPLLYIFLVNVVVRLGHDVVIEGVPCDAAIIDLHLGTRDGLEVIRDLRAKQPDCWIVATSGAFGINGLEDEAFAAGADRCVPKGTPDFPDLLIRALEHS